MSQGLFIALLVVLLILGTVAAILFATATDKPRNACPNVEPGVTPNPALATACPYPTLTMDVMYGQVEPVINAYLRAAPQEDAPGWVELAIPTGRWLVHSTDCALNPWTEVWYHSSAPNLAGVNDCPLDAWIPQSDAPCAMDDSGACDLTLDQSYQSWLASH